MSFISLDFFKDSKKVLVSIVYLSLFLDNILLTVVVPIIPDYLFFTEKNDELSKNYYELQQNLTKEGGILGPYFGANSIFAKISPNDTKNASSNDKEIIMNASKPAFMVKRSTESKYFANEEIGFKMSSRFKRFVLKNSSSNRPYFRTKAAQHSSQIRRDGFKLYTHHDRLRVNYLRNKVDNSYENIQNGAVLAKVIKVPEDKRKEPQADKLVFIKSGHLQSMAMGNCTNQGTKYEIYSLVPRDKDPPQPPATPSSPLYANEPKLLDHRHLQQDARTTHVEEAVEENGRVGILLASKALVQIVVNPLVGLMTSHFGYHLPLFIGSVNLLAAALMFAFGERYTSLLLARSLQGVASACIGVSGMCLVAEQYPEEGPRSKVMGVVLGSIALGVLLGYPFGSLMYDFVGKSAPFIIIAMFVLLNGVLQLFFLDLKTRDVREASQIGWCSLLSDGLVLITAGAILLSTSAMAILEPCLPIWLMDNIKPEKWQLGTVFIPDSLGYLIGTNCFGMVAYRLGRWRVAIMAMILVGLSSMAVPSAGGVTQLAAPHFGIGLGIGVVDAALVPLLANLVDARYSANYGSVYALQQTAVSLAYFLGPLAGGELVRAIGFPWLMRCVGLLILLYCPLLVLIGQQSVPITAQTSLMSQAPFVTYNTEIDGDVPDNNNLYRRFVNAEDSD